MIDDVIALMLKSDLHRDWYVHDLERLVTPAIEAKKMSVVYEDKLTSKTAMFPRPTGLYSHAFLPRDIQKRYESGSKKLPSEIWKYGPNDGTLFVIDFIAPYQNALKISKFAQKELTGRYLEVYPYDGAKFLLQKKGRRKGFATFAQEGLQMRRFSCVQKKMVGWVTR